MPQPDHWVETCTAMHTGKVMNYEVWHMNSDRVSERIQRFSVHRKGGEEKARYLADNLCYAMNAMSGQTVTAAQIRCWIEQTGLPRKLIARMLGFRSENSLRQCETGKAMLPAYKAVWLESFATFCGDLAKQQEVWLEQHPPPAG